MRKFIDQLKPKANKLLAFVTNWHLAKPEKNIELSKSLSQLMEEGVFPSPIRNCFRFPHFKKLLHTMENQGRLFVMPNEKEAIDASHPPIEIQNIQIIVEAFHKLVHLDYNRQTVKEPCVQAKIFGDNILDYLSTVNLFVPFEGKIVDEILDYLFQTLRKTSEKLKELILKHPSEFSPTLLSLIHEPIFASLLHIDRPSYDNYMIEDWHPILVELNIDAKLSRLNLQIKDIAVANAHKLLNQLKTVLDEKRQFYQRNLPLFVPKRLKEEVLKKIETLSDKPCVVGQQINELFYDEFSHERYEVVQARQLGTNSKFENYAEKFWPVKKSLHSLIDQYEPFLPRPFCDYFRHYFLPLSPLLEILGKPNHLAVQFVVGFYNTQLDYLADLLTQEKCSPRPFYVKEEINSVMPILYSFFENYYSHKPKASFKTIRSLCENLFLGEAALKSYSLDQVKKRLNDLFSFLLPREENQYPLLEASLDQVIKLVSEISKKLPCQSPEYLLLSHSLQQLLILDLPSYSESWHALGALLSVFTLLSDEKTFGSWLSTLEKMPFFQVMFHR